MENKPNNADVATNPAMKPAWSWSMIIASVSNYAWVPVFMYLGTRSANGFGWTKMCIAICILIVGVMALSDWGSNVPVKTRGGRIFARILSKLPFFLASCAYFVIAFYFSDQRWQCISMAIALTLICWHGDMRFVMKTATPDIAKPATALQKM